MNEMDQLVQLVNRDRPPSFIFGYGYTGPEKPSDLSTAGYLLLFLAAVGTLLWVTFFY